MINNTQVEDSVLAIGAFIGLLSPPNSTGEYSVNTDFFADPSSVVEKCGDRLSDLVQLSYLILGAPAANPPAVFDSATWLMIQNPETGGSSPFFLVVPAQVNKEAPTSGEIGIGSILPVKVGNLTIEVYFYIPLFDYNSSGATFLLDQPNSALQFGLEVINNSGKFTSSANTLIEESIEDNVIPNQRQNSFFTRIKRFFNNIGRRLFPSFFRNTIPNTNTSGTVSFSGIKINAAIFLNETSPSFSLEFLSLSGTTAPSTYTTLDSLLAPNVETWLGTAVLQDSSVTTWLNSTIGDSEITPGQLLTAAGFVSDKDKVYTLTLNSLKGQSPKQIALHFLFAMLNTLAKNGPEKPLVKLPNGGIFISSRTKADKSTDYALGIQTLLSLDDGGSADPAVDLCLGAWLSGETNDDNWMTRSVPPGSEIPEDGILLWLINNTTENVVSFAPDFTLSSLGLNISGNAGTALFTIDGYTLKEAELRATLNAVTLTDTSTWTYGFAAKLAELGIPLLPSQSSSTEASGENPVAQSLLQTNTSSGGDSSPPGDQESVNPTFGVAAAWYLDSELNLQLFDSEDQPTDKPIIIPVNRQLGPLSCEKIGVGWVNSDHLFSILFDGSVRLGPLKVSLEGLTVGIPVTTPTELDKYTLDLNGMGIDFKSGAISMDGVFVKVPPSSEQPFTEYDGTISINAEAFSLSALGSYAYLPPTSTDTSGYTSLFIFGLFLEPLGGPEFFFVTGLAAGFGYNRAINLPDSNSVTDFPFVALLNDPEKYGSLTDPQQLLSQIDSYVPPQRGEYWLAAGVRFTSFDLINTSALLSVEFGNELEIGILGISWMSLPPPPKPGGQAPETKFAYAELGIDIQIIPAQGIIMASAVLTPNSYVIDPACHLTGGFAFYVWFGDNPHAGQFVFTIGGYNPNFQAPSYFPKVSRLGFSWNVSDEVSISGGAYFALTPSAIMAGGGLNVIFSDGNLNAWFIAKMDALVQWAPFQYNVDISINIGVSYKLGLLFTSVTLKVELGASVQIWGPETGGIATISWYIISFTVPFGAKQSTPSTTIGWTTADGQGFADTLLPNKPATASAALALSTEQALDSSDTSSLSMLTITPVSGVTGYLDDTNSTWVVRPASFAFSTLTAFPTTELSLSPAEGETPKTWSASAYTSVNVRPMNTVVNSSVLNVEVQNEDGSIFPIASRFNFNLSTASVPAAKWGSPIPTSSGMPGTPEMNNLLSDYLMGFQSIVPQPTVLTPSGDSALTIDSTTAFADITIDNPTDFLPLSATTQPNETIPQVSANALSTIETALKSTTVTATRTAVYNTLITNFGIDPLSNNDLAKSAFAAEPGLFLNGNPLILPAS